MTRSLPRRHGLWAALACVAGLGSACAAQPRVARSTEPVRATARGAGPVILHAPTGARYAENATELAQLLQDPAGPTEIWLRPRTYLGNFVVRRTLALHGELGATLNGNGQGTVLDLGADHIVIDNLLLEHSGQRHTAEDAGIKGKGLGIRITHVRVRNTLFGITLGECPRCEIERSHVEGLGDDVELKGDGIKLWESDDARVRNCVVEHVRDVVVWYSRRVMLESNTVSHSRYGTHFMYAHDSTVRDSHIVDNVVSIFVMYSSRLHVLHNVLAGARGAAGIGVGFKESDAVQVEDNWVVANTTGIYLDGTPRSARQPVLFSGNVFALNDVAMRFHGVREALTFSNNEFRQNTVVADIEGGGDALGTTFIHNYFSDYVGYDLDNNGIGDVAYQVKRLSGELLDEHPQLEFFQGTVAIGLIDAIANAVPVFASKLLLIDREPSVNLAQNP